MFIRSFYAVAMLALIFFLAACDMVTDLKMPSMKMPQISLPQFTMPAWMKEAGKPVTVTILHTNDFHSQLETLKVADEPEQGGAARLAGLIQQVREEKGGVNRVFLLSGGDNFQGSLFYTAWKGSAEVMVMNHLKYDAVTLGNHEFDMGSVELARALRGEPVKIAGTEYTLPEPANFPVLTSNIDVSNEPALKGLTLPRMTIKKNGETFGLLGATTESTAVVSSPGDKVKFLDYVTAVQTQVDALKAEGVNKIILLSHCATTEDARFAPMISGVDVIVAGHDHALLGDPEKITAMGLPEQAKRVKGPYPIIAKDKDGHNTLIVSAMEKGRWLGNIDVTFDGDGVIADGAWKANPIFVRACAHEGAAEDCTQAIAPEDKKLAEKIAKFHAPIEAMGNEVLGEATVSFARPTPFSGAIISMGDLVADVLLDAARKQTKTDASLVNWGGVRATIDKGTVRFKDVNAVLPFDNTLVVIDMTGTELVETIDHGVTRAYKKSPGAFPQVSGMDITYCANDNPCPTSLRKGGAVTSLQMGGKPVQMEQHYFIATNNYLARGGDYYETFKNICARETTACNDTGILLKTTLADWFRTHSPVTAAAQERVRPLR